ncbi:DegT/DnrJ/EryC1/StrS family aminotransferase [Pantanalinema rosaneae CENA516]|uniref:DegT/DnrJ/EryC1/StrS family aminotransferase n=1 Tax=Pantanalinema rosaneae TaxID=1620701 RepID=UPI003D6E9644
MIPIFHTYIHPSAVEKVYSVLDSTLLSEGKQVKEFEEALSIQLGLINPVAVHSGTSALHLALLLAGVKPGDEVICPTQTFVASALAILYVQAIPVFADIQYETGNICPQSIASKITDKTKAIMTVHWGGYPCDLDVIHAIAQQHQLVVIEDAAHALGATYKNQVIGAISDFTCFSFQAIKHLTTGDGGAVCCLNHDLVARVLASRWFGIDRANSQLSFLGERQYDITEVGYKYHLNNYAAALGLANLQGFQDRLEKRRQIAKRYSEALGQISGIRLFEYQVDRQSAYWLYGMHVERRDDFILALRDRGVTASVVHQRIDRNSVFGGKRPNLVHQARFDETQVHIPIHDGLKEEDIAQVIEAIKSGW